MSSRGGGGARGAGRWGPQAPAPGGDGAGGPMRRAGGRRETIELVVVVFMAFLLWSLQAEGFVIPTGSMAPTLMGRHKEITCPECGHAYTVNADRESEPDRGGRAGGCRIRWGTCENCRYETTVADAPSFSGDRIYVMNEGVSLPFLPAGAGGVRLKRWDVAVFKLPEDPDVRYIKRLVGMPDEVLRIQGGDVWVRPRVDGGEFVRPLRPLPHQQAMQVTVYDDRHRPSSFRGDPAWRRWAAPRDGDWTEPEPGTFVPAPEAADWAELRYRHLVPGPDQWAAVRGGGGGSAGPPRASLITDYSSYNTDISAADREDPRRAARAWLQPHWVSDLTLSMRLTVRRPAGRLRLELIAGGRPNRCEIDLAAGEARLSHGGMALGPPAALRLSPDRAHDLTFANVDGRLTLWVDGDLPFGEGVSYPTVTEPLAPTAADLDPARIAARGAEIAVDGLLLRRDVYYTLDPSEIDYANIGDVARFEPSALFELLSDPDRFAALSHREPRDYPIAPGRYLMLGDNSPWSRDARAWGRIDQADPSQPDRGWDHSGRASWEVPAVLLVGKAFCVYWTHLRPVWPNLRLGDDIRFPAVPDLGHLRWIR